MNFIKKVFDEKVDEEVHMQFQKFSKGEFRNRALIEAKNSKGKYTIKTSAEFVNGLVRAVAEMIGSEKVNVTGAIVSTNDLTGEFEFKGKKQFQGVKRYLIDDEMTGEKIIGLLNRFPKTFFALSFEFKDTKLKVKPKAPKSGKPGKGGKKPKADFCTLKTTNKELAESFVFENTNFKKAEINHTFFIEEIVIPKELKNEKDFSVVREKALRKGKIVRDMVIDENILKSEKKFEA